MATTTMFHETRHCPIPYALKPGTGAYRMRDGSVAEIAIKLVVCALPNLEVVKCGRAYYCHYRLSADNTVQIGGGYLSIKESVNDTFNSLITAGWDDAATLSVKAHQMANYRDRNRK